MPLRAKIQKHYETYIILAIFSYHMCNNLTYFYDVLTSKLKNKRKIKSTLKLWNDNGHSRLNMNVVF